MGGFTDGYVGDDDADLPSAPPAATDATRGHRTAGQVITCPACASAHVGPRSSDAFGGRTQFRCKGCGKHFTELLPTGYERVYIVRQGGPDA